jgi:hypothetical protein
MIMITKEFIRDLKYRRMKPEERFMFEMFEGVEIYNSDKYADYELYKKNGDIIVEYDLTIGYFYCCYFKIWSVFVTKFNFNYKQISEFIKGWVVEHFKLEGITHLI